MEFALPCLALKEVIGRRNNSSHLAVLVHRPKLVTQFLVPLRADVAPLVLQLHAAAAGLKYISDLLPTTHT